MIMKPDQERVRGLLTDTVTLLCKNGLQYNKELKVQGLLGITLDNDDVFVVHINEIFDGLISTQVAGIQSGDNITSAIVAADSATQPTEREISTVKSRKSTPHKHGIPRTSSPMLQGSSKRKASLIPPMMRVKKEEDDDVVLMESGKNEQDNSDFIPGATELSGDGDREAMRMSYGGAMENASDEGPPTKRRTGSSKGSESFTNDQTETESGAPFITGIVRHNNESSTDMLGNNSSLDGSQLSGVGQMQDGQVVFDNTPGCSAWDTSQIQDGSVNEEEAQDPGSQDSINESPVVMNLIQHGLLVPPGARTNYNSSLHARQQQQYQNVNHASTKALKSPSRPAKYGTWHVNPSASQVNHTQLPGYVSGNLGKRYRSKNSPYKPYACDYPGCNLKFYEKRSLTRHQRMKHQ